MAKRIGAIFMAVGVFIVANIGLASCEGVETASAATITQGNANQITFTFPAPVVASYTQTKPTLGTLNGIYVPEVDIKITYDIQQGGGTISAVSKKSLLTTTYLWTQQITNLDNKNYGIDATWIYSEGTGNGTYKQMGKQQGNIIPMQFLTLNTVSTTTTWQRIQIATWSDGTISTTNALRVQLVGYENGNTVEATVMEMTFNTRPLLADTGYIIWSEGITNATYDGQDIVQAETDAYNNGYEAGQTDGKQVGYAQGYAAGHTDGVQSANKYTFTGLLNAVIYAPMKALTGLLNFEILGVNMLSVFTGLLTVALILGVVRLLI